MNKIIVTGGAGYIGSHACKYLASSGYVPVTYDNLATGNRWAVRWGPFEEGDILDRDRLAAVFAAHRPIGVMHFAAASLVAESVARPELYYRINVAGGLNVVEMCARNPPAVFILSSTCAVYGNPARVPIGENEPLQPINPYGTSKMMLERALADIAAASRMPRMTLRYFNAAGADGEIGECRPVETHLIPLALDAAAGRRPPLALFGSDYPTPDGTAVRDYIHVADLARAHVQALERLLGGGSSGTVNLGTGRGASVRDILTTVETVTGSAVPHSLAPRRTGDAAALVADPAHARSLLGRELTPMSDLRSIVESAWAWQSHPLYAQAQAPAAA